MSNKTENILMRVTEDDKKFIQEKASDAIFEKLEQLKKEYLAELGELNTVLVQLEREQNRANNIMQKEAFRDGENRNITITLPNVANITNEMLEKSIINNYEVDKYIREHLL